MNRKNIVSELNKYFEGNSTFYPNCRECGSNTKMRIIGYKEMFYGLEVVFICKCCENTGSNECLIYRKGIIPRAMQQILNKYQSAVDQEAPL